MFYLCKVSSNNNVSNSEHSFFPSCSEPENYKLEELSLVATYVEIVMATLFCVNRCHSKLRTKLPTRVIEKKNFKFLAGLITRLNHLQSKIRLLSKFT